MFNGVMFTNLSRSRGHGPTLYHNNRSNHGASCGGFLSHGGTPGYHPCHFFGFPTINHPAIGDPHLWKPPCVGFAS